MSGTGGGGGVVIHTPTKSGTHMRRHTVLTKADLVDIVAELPDTCAPKADLQTILADWPDD